METMNAAVQNGTEIIMLSSAEHESLKAENNALKAEIETQKAYISELEKKLSWFMEQFHLNQARRFGASSEGSNDEVLAQMSLLFNEPEAALPQPEKEEGTTVRAHTRK